MQALAHKHTFAHTQTHAYTRTHAGTKCVAYLRAQIIAAKQRRQCWLINKALYRRGPTPGTAAAEAQQPNEMNANAACHDPH